LSELQARTTELTRSVDELALLGDVGRALGSTLDLETVLQTIVTRANQLAGTADCTIWEYDQGREAFHLRVSHYADAAGAALLPALGRVTTIRKGQGVTTQVVELRQPVQIHDIAIGRVRVGGRPVAQYVRDPVAHVDDVGINSSPTCSWGCRCRFANCSVGPARRSCRCGRREC
jgi:GAF domain-containing protein